MSVLSGLVRDKLVEIWEQLKDISIASHDKIIATVSSVTLFLLQIWECFVYYSCRGTKILYFVVVQYVATPPYGDLAILEILHSVSPTLDSGWERNFGIFRGRGGESKILEAGEEFFRGNQILLDRVRWEPITAAQK